MNENETTGAAFDEAAYTAFRNTDDGKRAYAEAVAKARRKFHLVTPEPAEPIWDNIPPELTILPRWVLRQGKVPKQLSGAGASSTDPETWATFENVKAAYQAGDFDGIGIVLNGDGLICWDFDHCLDADGRITDPKIEAYVRQLNSRTEVRRSAIFDAPWGAVFDTSGNLVVMNYSDGTIAKFTSQQLKASGAPIPEVSVTGSNI
jgi:hypothetical protein